MGPQKLTLLLDPPPDVPMSPLGPLPPPSLSQLPVDNFLGTSVRRAPPFYPRAGLFMDAAPTPCLERKKSGCGAPPRESQLPAHARTQPSQCAVARFPYNYAALTWCCFAMRSLLQPSPLPFNPPSWLFPLFPYLILPLLWFPSHAQPTRTPRWRPACRCTTTTGPATKRGGSAISTTPARPWAGPLRSTGVTPSAISRLVGVGAGAEAEAGVEPEAGERVSSTMA